MNLVNAFNMGRAKTPVLHASPATPVPVRRGDGQPLNGAYVALCGVTVRNVTTVPFVPHGAGRRCTGCLVEAMRL